MKKRIPLALRITLIALGCIIAAVAALYFGIVDLAGKTQAAYEQITPVNLAEIDDGVYNGKAGGFICSVDLDVIVNDHRITDIQIKQQVNGGGKYKAGGILPRIIKSQSPQVDAVSGATLTSKTFMVAVYNALAGK